VIQHFFYNLNNLHELGMEDGAIFDKRLIAWVNFAPSHLSQGF
jgi:hypothetical protein